MDDVPTDYDLLQIMQALKKARVPLGTKNARSVASTNEDHSASPQDEEHKLVQEIDAFFDHCDSALNQRRQFLKAQAKLALGEDPCQDMIFAEDSHLIGKIQSACSVKSKDASNVNPARKQPPEYKKKVPFEKLKSAKPAPATNARTGTVATSKAAQLDISSAIESIKSLVGDAVNYRTPLKLTASDEDELFQLLVDVEKSTSKMNGKQFKQLMTRERDSVMILCACLKCSNVEVILVSMSILEDLLDLCKPEFPHNGELNVCSQWIEECGGLDSIEQLQQHESSTIYEKSVHILTRFFGDEESLFG
eukprot:TRINITY_DN3023_c0_g1_i1.p1 TRINITY_DN3023_c0_g1~~TRINITY_DN3023_c0_g1_i1.p1  ORF type:complete len:314 (-),score=99.72 TRINITY_DN3023_c0_g1_i1:438-1358(-)